MASVRLPSALKPLLERTEKMKQKSATDRVQEALALADELYSGKTHWTGQPLLSHTLTILERLLPYGPDEDAVVSCLLIHSLRKNVSAHTIGIDEIERRFGPTVRSIVSGVHLLSHVTRESKRMTLENMRLMFLRVSDDIRIVLLLLLKRQLALEHLEKMAPGEPKWLARDILQLFSPVAARLGMYGIKHALEAGAFPIAYPVDAARIEEQLASLKKQHGNFLPKVCAALQKELALQGIAARVEGRQKLPYSLFRKLQSKGMTRVEQLFDLYAIRVIVQDEPSCYRALGVLHSLGRPVPNRFKDFIAFAKPNGYQSLHTTLAELPKMPDGLLAEVQIRTEEMHRRAEFGIAAHWSYKEGGKSEHIMRRVELQKALTGAEIGDDTRRNAMPATEHIFVLTPMGDIIELPEGATPLDFAFHVHTNVGLAFRAARVNGSVVPLSHELENGDVVEIQKFKEPQPSPKWMSLLKTASARSRLRHYLAERQRPELIARGRELMNAELRKRKLPPLDSDLSILRKFDADILPVAAREELLAGLAQGSQSASSFFPHLSSLPEDMRRTDTVQRKPGRTVASAKPRVVLEDDMTMPIRFARCCKADEKQTKDLVGIVSRDGEVRIHGRQCKMVKGGNPERRVKAEWR